MFVLFPRKLVVNIFLKLVARHNILLSVVYSRCFLELFCQNKADRSKATLMMSFNIVKWLYLKYCLSIFIFLLKMRTFSKLILQPYSFTLQEAYRNLVKIILLSSVRCFMLI